MTRDGSSKGMTEGAHVDSAECRAIGAGHSKRKENRGDRRVSDGTGVRATDSKHSNI